MEGRGRTRAGTSIQEDRPLANLILGIACKCRGMKTTKNIVVGKVEITTQNLQSDSEESQSGSQTVSQSDTDAFDYDSMSNITFTDTKQITDFEASLRGSNLWTNSIATPTSGIVPEFYSWQTTKAQGFDHFMIYKDLGTYNALPDRSGTYRFIYLAYGSRKRKCLSVNTPAMLC